MLVSIETEAYDKAKFSSPWIAKIGQWPERGLPDMLWGPKFKSEKGKAGTLEIEAERGDVIRWGQKCKDDPEKSKSFYGSVQEDGSVYMISREDARKMIAPSGTPISGGYRRGQKRVIVKEKTVEKVVDRIPNAVKDVLQGLVDFLYEDYPQEVNAKGRTQTANAYCHLLKSFIIDY